MCMKQECRSSPPSGRLSFSVKTALSKLPLPLLALLLSLLIRGDLAELGCFRAAGAFFDQLSVVERWCWRLWIGWFGAAVVPDLGAVAIGFVCSWVAR
ncbi:hypothetical protein ACOSQ4_007666 [Xanthoceras sorbifolium]